MNDSTTIRDALEAAVPQDEPIVESSTPEPVSEPVVDAAPEPVDPTPVAESTAEPAAEEPSKSRKRDEGGKFAKAEGIQPGPKSEPKTEAKAVEKAPASWKPDTREHWASLPPTVRTEVLRREAEVQKTLQETAEARKTVEQLSSIIRPYEAFIRAENSNPLQAIDNLMATAVRLRTAPAPDLAQMVAGIVKQYGVGRFGQNFIEQLDTALAGEMPKSDPVQSQVQQVLQQQLAPVQQFMSQFQQAQLAQQQQVQQQAVSEVSQFLDKAEFGDDVREEMADIMELSARRGREISLSDAYKQACLVNPRVRSVLESRAKARSASQINATTQKAKAAAVSVSGSPAMAVPQGGAVDIRSAIEAAIASHSR